MNCRLGRLPSKNEASSARPLQFERDKVALLETNVDDATGEIIAHTIERLLEEGALDASAVPFTGKKGRPGFTVRVTCYPVTVEKFAAILLRETGSFGLKLTTVDRLKVQRKEPSMRVVIDGKPYSVRIKTSDQNFRSKPEFADAENIAKSTGLHLLKIL